MTIPRFTAISAHWKRVPPIEVTLASIASVLGIKIGGEKTAATSTSSIQELFESAQGAGFTTGRPEWLKKTKMW